MRILGKMEGPKMSNHWIAWIYILPLAIVSLVIATLFSKGLRAKVEHIDNLPQDSKVIEFGRLVKGMRVQLIVCVFGVVPAILLSKWLFSKSQASDQVDGATQIIILIGWFVSLVVLDARAGFLICPKCSKNFFLGERRGRRGLPLLLSCRACGYKPGSPLG